LAGEVSVDAVMAELRKDVRRRLRERLVLHGASTAFMDPALFAEVERLLQSAANTSDPNASLLPEFLGEPETWRLQTSMQYQSHRTSGIASVLIFVKRQVLMPVLRWLFEYSRNNFERQRHVNQVLFVCIQELAIENARLRRDLRSLAGGGTPQPERPEASERQ
jgi:hypothetical protein